MQENQSSVDVIKILKQINQSQKLELSWLVFIFKSLLNRIKKFKK